MKKVLVGLALGLMTVCMTAHAEQTLTKRVPQFANERVKVWETTIYPGTSQVLPWHRHDHARVVVALTDGKLKVVNNKKEEQVVTLVKNKAYYLKADQTGLTHYDINEGKKPLKVLVIEFVD